jgi:hypothetical protein
MNVSELELDHFNFIEFMQEVESIYQSIETQQAIVGGVLFDW